MLTALAKLVPFRDYLYAALAIAGVTYYNIHVHDLIKADEAKTALAIARETSKVQAAAQKRIDALNSQHAAELAANKATYDASLKSNSVADATELQRLRDIAAKGSGRPHVDSPGSPSAPADTGGSSLVRLGYVSEELAAGLRDARSDLAACYTDRDSLTGK
jgi:hypothetical protein